MATLPSRFTAFVAATVLLVPAAPALAIQPIVPVEVPVAPAADADAAVDAAAAATESTPASGTATSRSVPLAVTVGDVPIELGVTTLSATTDKAVNAAGPLATSAVTLADIAGVKLGQLSVSSDGTTSSDGAVLDEATIAGPITLIAGKLTATADEAAGTATAALQRLDLAVELLEGLGIGTSIDGASALAGPSGAVATHGLQVTDINLTLGSLLGDVLGELPLDVLIDLAESLGIVIPADLSAADDVIAATEALIAAVAEAVTTSDAVTSAADALVSAELLDPIAAYGDPATYEALLASAQGIDLVADPAAAVVALALLHTDADLIALDCDLGVPSLLNLADVAADTISCIESHLAALTAAIDALQDELTALTDAVTAYADAVAEALAAAAILDSEGTSLEDVLAAVLDLIDSLDGASLLSLSGFGIDQKAVAVAGDLAGSSATSTCDKTTLQVALLPPLEIDTCDASEITAIVAAVDQAVATITTVLDTVGVVDLGDGVSLKLLEQIYSGVTEGTDGRVTAISTVEILRLNIPEITVDPCAVADGLVCALGLDLLSPVLDQLPDLDNTLGDAQATVEAALATAVDALAALEAEVDVLDQVGASDVVSTVVDALIGILNGLDLGNLGAAQGVTLPGALIVIDPQVTATHLPGVTAAGSPEPAANPDPAPGPDPTLPNTGGGAAVLAILALGGAFALRRKMKVED